LGITYRLAREDCREVIEKPITMSCADKISTKLHALKLTTRIKMSKLSNTNRSTEKSHGTKGFQTGWLISGEICFAAVLLFFANQPFDIGDTTPAPQPALIVVEIPPAKDPTHLASRDEFGFESLEESELKTAVSMQLPLSK